MSLAKLADEPAAFNEDDGTDDLIHRLSGENLALQSVLYGLCMGLSQMSDVHREVVAQAFEYAYSAPRGGPANVGEQATRVREQAFRDAVGRLKEAVLNRFGRM